MYYKYLFVYLLLYFPTSLIYQLTIVVVVGVSEEGWVSVPVQTLKKFKEIFVCLICLNISYTYIFLKEK